MCETGFDNTPDCSSDTGRLAFLTAGAKTNTECYSPLIKLVGEEEEDKISTTPTEVSRVSITNIIVQISLAAVSSNRSVKMTVQEM